MLRLRYVLVGSILTVLVLGTVMLQSAPSVAESTRTPGSEDKPFFVRVINTITEAIPVEVTNVPAVEVATRQPHQFAANNFPGHDVRLTNFRFDVPAGKRLVIENASVKVQVPAGQHVVSSISGNGPRDVGFAQTHLVLVKQGTFDGADLYTANHPLQLWVGPGEENGTILVKRSGTGGVMIVEAAFSGYLEDL